MSKQSSNTPLQVKKWRALSYDWEVLSTYGNTQRLYCLTDFQAAWLLSNTEYFAWSTRWKNCPCTESDMLALKADMELNLMSCSDFNFSDLSYIYSAIQQAELYHYNDLYNIGGIAGLNSNTPTDYYSGDDSDERLNALCMAVDTYVRSYLNNWLDAAIAAQLGLVFVGTAVNVVPYIGQIACLALYSLALITQTAIDAVEDESAIEDVVCCMYSALIGVAVNQANFEGSLDGCGFTGGTNAAIVRDLVASDLNNFSNWLSFLNALGNSYVFMLAGVDWECPCTTPEWTSVLDFTVDDYGVVFQSIAGSDPLGEWIDGVGIVPICDFFNGSNKTQIYFKLDFDDAQVKTLNIQGTFRKAASQPNSLTAIDCKILDTTLSTTPLQILRQYGDFPTAGIDYAVNYNDSIDPTQNGNQLYCSFRPSQSSCYISTNVITSITITGTGTKPSQLP